MQYFYTKNLVKMANDKLNSSMEFIKSYWLVILGAFILLPYLKIFISRMQIKTTVDDVKNTIDLNSQINALDSPTIQNNKANIILKSYSVSQRNKIKADVQSFAFHLGTATGLSWYQTLTENDAKCVEILNVWINHLPKFSELYFSVYTQSRNLKTDFNKLIDESNKKSVYLQQAKYKLKFF